MEKKLKIISLVFLFIVLLMFNIWQKYERVQISYDIQRLVEKIGELEEQKKDLLIKKINLETPERIKKVAEDKLQMKEIQDKNMIVLGVKE